MCVAVKGDGFGTEPDSCATGDGGIVEYSEDVLVVQLEEVGTRVADQFWRPTMAPNVVVRLRLICREPQDSRLK